MFLKNVRKYAIVIEEMDFKLVACGCIFYAKDATFAKILQEKYPNCFEVAVSPKTEETEKTVLGAPKEELAEAKEIQVAHEQVEQTEEKPAAQVKPASAKPKPKSLL
jgi:hypothetical protein